jgi:hypothetical protein
MIGTSAHIWGCTEHSAVLKSNISMLVCAQIILADDYLVSDGEEDIQLTPSSLSDASTAQETASDLLKLHGSPTSSIDEVDEHRVSMPLSTPNRLCRSICGRELSIAELKAALGLACGRHVNAQSADYYSSKPPGGKPPVRLPSPCEYTPRCHAPPWICCAFPRVLLCTAPII